MAEKISSYNIDGYDFKGFLAYLAYLDATRAIAVLLFHLPTPKGNKL
jgi:hypothetical protein